MDAAATCKYYVTKLLGISPPKPNCVYDVRSGNVRDREQKSLFRVFYRSHGKRRKRRPCRAAGAQESYAPSMHAEDAGAKIGDGHVLEEDTVEDIEKKFQGFRNVFEKCKVKKKKPSRLFNVSSGLRFTLVANTMLIDGQKKSKEAAAAGNAIEEGDGDGDDDDDDDDDDGRDVEGDDVGDGEGDDEEDEEGAGGEDRTCDDTAAGAAAQMRDAVENRVDGEPAENLSKCPKDVADKVNSWIDSSVKQTDEYSEEESLFVDDEEVNANDLSILIGRCPGKRE